MVRTVMVALVLAMGFGGAVRADEAALKEVNDKRASRGLPPFVYDATLDAAAQAAAEYRASKLIFGHVMDTNLGDFRFLPAGHGFNLMRLSAGCAAYPDRYGWMSCCTNDRYKYAGAAWVRGRDGKRYMHLFVRN